MSGQWRKAMGAMGAVVIVLVSERAAADGMWLVKRSGSVLSVQEAEQRAVFWLRNGVWELHLEVRFSRPEAEGAWIVPFPSRPEVFASDPRFFDELELLTAPVAVYYCENTYAGGRGCNPMVQYDHAGSGEEQIGAEGWVRVWQAGVLGGLEFAVLSASDGESVLRWLEDNGYSVGQEVGRALQEMDAEGQFYVVAQVAEEADASAPMAVGLRFPELEAPIYPLRLTRFMLSESGELHVTLYILMDPGLSDYRPDRLYWDTRQWEINTATQYSREVEKFRSAHAGSAILRTFRYHYGGPGDPAAATRCAPAFTSSVGCVRTDELSPEVPDEWSELATEALGTRITRYDMWLGPEAMEEDLSFVVEGVGPDNPAVYLENTGTCYYVSDGESEEDEAVRSCWTAGRRLPVWALFVLIWLGFRFWRSRSTEG